MVERKRVTWSSSFTTVGNYRQKKVIRLTDARVIVQIGFTGSLVFSFVFLKELVWVGFRTNIGNYRHTGDSECIRTSSVSPVVSNRHLLARILIPDAPIELAGLPSRILTEVVSPDVIRRQ